MTPKNFGLVLFLTLTLAFFTTACQSPLKISLRGETNQGGPHAAFIPFWAVVQTEVRQPLSLQTFYTSPDRLNKLKALAIKINGQPVKFHRSGGLLLAPYPPAEGEAPASLEAACASNSNYLAVLQISPETIQLADTPVLETLPARFPNSTWPVSLTWYGCFPGTYELSLAATDTANPESQPVTQRIEVK